MFVNTSNFNDCRSYDVSLMHEFTEFRHFTNLTQCIRSLRGILQRQVNNLALFKSCPVHSTSSRSNWQFLRSFQAVWVSNFKATFSHSLAMLLECTGVFCTSFYFANVIDCCGFEAPLSECWHGKGILINKWFNTQKTRKSF